MADVPTGAAPSGEGKDIAPTAEETAAEDAKNAEARKKKAAAAAAADGAGPPQLPCHLCGVMQTATGLGTHYKKCRKMWIEDEATKPEAARRQCPRFPRISAKAVLVWKGPTTNDKGEEVYTFDIGKTNKKGEPDAKKVPHAAINEYTVMATRTWKTESLEMCPTCHRSFYRETFQKHVKGCHNNGYSHQYRSVNDVVASMRTGNPAYHNTAVGRNVVVSKPSKVKWTKKNKLGLTQAKQDPERVNMRRGVAGVWNENGEVAWEATARRKGNPLRLRAERVSREANPEPEPPLGRRTLRGSWGDAAAGTNASKLRASAGEEAKRKADEKVADNAFGAPEEAPPRVPLVEKQTTRRTAAKKAAPKANAKAKPESEPQPQLQPRGRATQEPRRNASLAPAASATSPQRRRRRQRASGSPEPRSKAGRASADETAVKDSLANIEYYLDADEDTAPVSRVAARAVGAGAETSEVAAMRRRMKEMQRSQNDMMGAMQRLEAMVQRLGGPSAPPAARRSVSPPPRGRRRGGEHAEVRRSAPVPPARAWGDDPVPQQSSQRYSRGLEHAHLFGMSAENPFSFMGDLAEY